MLKPSPRFALCAAITLSSLAAPAFAQTSHSRPNVGVDREAEPSTDNALEYVTSWIGNSYSGENPNPPINSLLHVPLDMDSIYVTSDGRVFTNTIWDEGGRAVSVFRNGQLISPDGNNGGGVAIAAAGSQVFVSYSPGGSGVGILNANDLSNTGLSLSGSSTLANSHGIFGMTVAKGKLYVTENDVNLVEVFDIGSLTLVNTFSVNNPVRIAVDQAGGMWISHRDQTPLPSLDGNVYDINGQMGLDTVDHYDSSGTYSNTITVPDSAEVSALTVNGDGLLLVADDGPDQNIKIYASLEATPILIGTFGEKGGDYAGPVSGRVGPGRFRGITGIGTDARGNLYVSQSGFGLDMGVGHGLTLQSYSRYGTLNWERQGLEFQTMAAIDPHSETDVYDANHHFTLDYSKPPGKEARYVADTYNRFKYTQDVRVTSIGEGGQIVYIKGRKFLLVTPEYGIYTEIYRFDQDGDSEIAIPCVAFDYGSFQSSYQDFYAEPLNGEFIWRDVNGDGQMTDADGGWDPNEFFEPTSEGTYQGSPIPDEHRDGGDLWVDENGDVWQVNFGGHTPPYEASIHLRRYLFQGFDQYGAPIYDYNHMQIYSVTTDFPDFATVGSAEFFPNLTSGGTLFVMGGGPAQGTNIIARYDNWDKGNRTSSWVTNIATDTNPTNTWQPNSFTVAGDFFFVDFWQPHYNQVFQTKNGLYVGIFLPGQNVGGAPNVGNTDMWQANRAFERKNGEYILLQEDDYQAKILMYRWTPPNPLPIPPVPQPPSNIQGANNDEAANLSWTASGKALTFSVGRSTTSGGPYTTVDAGIYKTSASDVGLTNGQTYYYVVNEVAETGLSSANSSEVAVQVAALGTTYEAENAVLTAPAFTIYGGCDNLCSNNGFVAAAGSGSTITFNNVNVSKAGTYAVRIYDINGQSAQDWGLPPSDIGPTINITVNGGATIVSPQMGITDPNWNAPGYVTVPMALNAGNNVIELWSEATEGEPNIDRIVVLFAP